MSQDSSPLSKPGKVSPQKVDPEVKAKPERRHFSAEYKLRILAEADACTEAGQIGALLRREGLYSSNLTQQRSGITHAGECPLWPDGRLARKTPERPGCGLCRSS